MFPCCYLDICLCSRNEGILSIFIQACKYRTLTEVWGIGKQYRKYSSFNTLESSFEKKILTPDFFFLKEIHFLYVLMPQEEDNWKSGIKEKNKANSVEGISGKEH